MKNFVQDGKVIDYVNTGSAIPSGDVVVFPGIGCGVALTDIEATTEATTSVGSVVVDGVVEVAKAAGAISQGARVYWNGTAATTTVGSNTLMGFAFAAAESGDAKVKVKLVALGDTEPGNLAQAANVAALGETVDLTALVVTETVIAASDFTASNAAEPTKAEIDAGIDTLKTAVVDALDLKADNEDVETLRTEVEARLDAIEAKIDDVLAKLIAASLMAAGE